MKKALLCGIISAVNPSWGKGRSRTEGASTSMGSGGGDEKVWKKNK